MNNNLGEDSSESTNPPAMSPPLVNSETKPTNTLAVLPPRRVAVAVQGAWKQYGSGHHATPVLQNLNMIVPEGTM